MRISDWSSDVCSSDLDWAHLPQKKDCSMLGIANISESCVDYDSAVWAAIVDEGHRQDRSIELIASENIVSKQVRSAQGSILTNKYAEGYPGARYYGGRSEEHTSELQSLMRISYAVFCL